MTADQNLCGLRVLVPRPRPRGEQTADYLERLGAEVEYVPTLEIRCVADFDGESKSLLHQGKADLVVFVSVNAVQCLGAVAKGFGNLLGPHTMVAAMGSATAAACVERGIDVSFTPKESVDSEGLIRALNGGDWSGRKVVIVRGRGGREKLREHLEGQGARVDYLEVYDRVPVAAPSDDQIDQWCDAGFDAMVISSVAVLDSVLTYFGQRAERLLGRCHLVCPSDRVGNSCRNLGFNHVLVAEGPGDDDIARALAQITRRGS